MGAVCSEDRKHKKRTDEEQKIGDTQIENKDLVSGEQIKIIDEKKDILLKNVPKTFIKTQYKFKLNDLDKNKIYEENIDGDTKLFELLKHFDLRENCDFFLEFENNIKIGTEKISETFENIIAEVFNKNIPEIIEMKYTYRGLNIPENSIMDSYIESSKIIGTAILDNQDLFSIITYERDQDKITPYSYKRKDNEELIKFNLFTAFCNAKGNLYFSGGENEQTYDPDKTFTKYNDFFYIDLSKLNENKDKIIINELPNLIESRTWHSMIYVPYDYIFIVGGSNTKSVEIYNMKTNTITKDSELNEFRSECTLCLVNNIYLYAFCGFLIHQEFNLTIEKCNLLKEERKWEYVNLPEKKDFNLKPSFFGVSYFKNDEILLIGGNDNGDNIHFDYLYKIGKNEEEKDDIEEFNCNLNEVNSSIFRDKLFMPIGNNKSVNIPLIIGEDIKVFILDTENGKISTQSYGETL